MSTLRQAPEASVTDANRLPTAILDYLSPPVQAAVSGIAPVDRSDLAFLQAAHRYICRHVAPIYSVNELQPASLTLLAGEGSCSQRFAVLESVARARTIATRVRALWIAGRFWAPRFRLSRPFIPRQMLLAWPEFWIEGRWTGVESLFASVDELAARTCRRFTNDTESLFDAISHTPVDFDGRTAGCGDGACDLSHFVERDDGSFASRDELFGSVPIFQRTLRGRLFELIFGGRKSA